MRRLIFVCLLIATASAAGGNDGAITGVGGTIKLLDEHPSISLIAEYIDARISLVDNMIEVECLFVLSNRGQADTVQIGFPESYGGDTGPIPFEFFRSTVDGEEVDCSRRSSQDLSTAPEMFWWTKRVFFDSGQTRIIRNMYRAPAGSTIGFGDSPGPHRTFSYILSTGGSWAGVVEAATVVLSVEPCDSTWVPRNITPQPDSSGACEYVWRFQQFEPGSIGARSIHVSWRDMTADW